MKFRVRYRRARVTVEGTRPKECAACKAEGRVELHHWRYDYLTKHVRSVPGLALDYTIPLCYQCHRIADAIRKTAQDPERFHQVMAALSYAAINKRKEELNV